MQRLQGNEYVMKTDMRTIEAETINDAALITRYEAAPVARSGNYEDVYKRQVQVLQAVCLQPFTQGLRLDR